MGVLASAYRIAYTSCSSENVDRFIGPLLSYGTAEAAILLQFQAAVVFGGDVSQRVSLSSDCLLERGSLRNTTKIVLKTIFELRWQPRRCASGKSYSIRMASM